MMIIMQVLVCRADGTQVLEEREVPEGCFEDASAALPEGEGAELE